MEYREELIDTVIKNFLNDLTLSAKPLDHEQTIEFIGILQDYLKGVYNHEMPSPEFNYEGSPFDEQEFIEERLLKPYREKMVSFVKSGLRYYFIKDEFGQLMLFKKLHITEPIFNEDEYENYVFKLLMLLNRIKENLYLTPNSQINLDLTEGKALAEGSQEMSQRRFKSKNKEYTRIRQILLFYYLSKLAGMSRLESTMSNYALFAHVLFYYPTDNLEGSEVYKMLKKAPYLKENKALLKDLEFVKAQFKLIDHIEGQALVQKEIDFIISR